ncbi:hypothetical protein BJY04DRAFT_227711 [Aspergillus karnatakaensis]|uniref:uncharacterized protein n=1 Tax=Aspergillus karnatakaensis TaxID=1810916 RepID=UPI003CCCA894
MDSRHVNSAMSEKRRATHITRPLQDFNDEIGSDADFHAQPRAPVERKSLGPSAFPEEYGQSVLQDRSTHLGRSDTVKSSGEQHDWAFNRSPLAKLEVALGGISKEEKRARALEAERKLKERQAAAAAAAKAAAAPPEEPQKSIEAPIARKPVAESKVPVRRVSQKEPAVQAIPAEPTLPMNGDYDRHGKDAQQREHELRRPTTSHAKTPSLQTRPLSESQYASNKSPAVKGVKGGNVPRRSVSITHPPVVAHEAPHDLSKAPSRGSRDLAAQAFATENSPRTGAPAQKDAPLVGQLQGGSSGGVPGPRSGAQQLRENGRLLDSSAASPVAANLSAIQVLSSRDSIMPSSNETIQRSNTKSKRHTVSFDMPPPTPPPLSEWRNAPIGRLETSDFDFQTLDADKSKAWWEGGGTRDRRQSRALPKDYQKPLTQKLTSHKRFQPLIFLRCGPLLRYAGLKSVKIDGPNGPTVRETWRGSILIVTKDSLSSYEPAPMLRLFSQPMDLLPPPPVQINSEGVQLAPEYIDPTAGLMKLGRDGRPLYIKPVDHTEEELDLSFVESDEGIYEMSPSALDYGLKQPIPANRIHSMDGESIGVYKEIAGSRLYADPGRDATFWKFNIEIELGEKQQRVAYRLNQGPAIGFWVPPKGQSMNIMFHSGNGFSPGTDSNRFCGPDPMWRDVLNEHQTRPFHVMIGGGDQIFNDKVTADSAHFQDWLKIRDLSEKYDSPFNAEFKAEIENAYLENYSKWFSQGLFSLANSQIPMVNIWNDHEILEGFGSYPEEFMSSAVISGIGNLAFKYYLLFQHHSVPEETEVEEPSWILGPEPGPYIDQRSRHLFMSLGDGVAFLGLDCRTERTSDEILSEHSSDLIWDRCHREIVRGETKHLIVLLSIPIAYPRAAMVKNILNSRQSLGKAGLFGGLVNRHGTKVEIFDDHWTAKHHKSERKYLIEDLQDLAAEKSIRVTILSGDVHLAAIGQFYSNPSLNIPKDKDYRYMPNIISSGIAHTPTTEMISDTLNRRNQVHHMDSNTDEDMIPIFTHDVNNKPRNNKRLLPRRNWCSIRVYEPGATPTATPESKLPAPATEPRPNKLQRTLSLTRGDRTQGGLLRRLSSRRQPPTKEFNLGQAHPARRMSMDGPFPPAERGDSYFPAAPAAESRPGPLFRRPTNLSQKAAKRAANRGDDGAGTFVNLEGGLAVTLNLELNPKDPSGITTPYKLLIPALWFEGTEYDPPAAPVTKGWRKWLGVRKNASSKPSINDNEGEDEYTDEEDEELPQQHHQSQQVQAQPPQPQPHHNKAPEAIAQGGPVRARPVSTPGPGPGRRPIHDDYYDYDDDDEEEESELFLEPEPQHRPNVKRSTSLKKWFGRS